MLGYGSQSVAGRLVAVAPNMAYYSSTLGAAYTAMDWVQQTGPYSAPPVRPGTGFYDTQSAQRPVYARNTRRTVVALLILVLTGVSYRMWRQRHNQSMEWE